MQKMSTIKKKKRVSKKNKISWRKHVNINDVEEFLEEQRLEERLGPPLSTLTDDQLFKVDTKPSGELSAKEQKKLRLLKAPKCFSILQPYTNVPDPIKKRNRVRSKEERKNEVIKKKEAYNLANGIKKFREIQAGNDRKLYEKRKQSQPKKGEITENIWNDDEELDSKNSWFTKDTVKHNLRGTGKLRKHKKSIKQESAAPSVELPHPGMSYNPSYDDHQDLLKIVAEKESKIIKEEKHLNRVTRDMFTRITADKRDANWLKEMSEGLTQQNNSHNSDEESDNEFKSINPAVKEKRKTLKQRRKQKEQLKLQLMRRQAMLEKKKITDIHQLKILKKQIEKSDIKTNMLREKRKKIQLIKKKEPKRLSAVKFEETELEFNMGPDIAGNLRNIKKEGNLLSDRYKSMQKRNIIEPSVKRHRRKAKVKIYMKPGHKDDWIKSVAR